MRITGWLPGLWLIVVLLQPTLATAGEIQEISIGVLAFRGEAQAQRRWQSTADYLNEEIPGYEFEIRPLSAERMSSAVAQNELHFVLTNPGHYVELEAAYGVTRIVTLKNLLRGEPQTRFGAVIFTRADNRAIRDLEDLRGHSFMAVGPHAFGGFLMAWRELRAAGIEPERHLGELEFAGFPQDDIVYAVRDGRVAAGTVRTGVLESLAAQGLVRLDDFRVLAPRHTEGFPFLHSTRLYPEWPLARTRKASDSLAEEVAVTLMTMVPSQRAALNGSYAGWTVPQDYNTVHALYRDLQVGPYAVRPTFNATAARYSHWVLAGVLLLLGLVALALYLRRLKLQLAHAQGFLDEETANRERMSRELHKLSQALRQTADSVMITSAGGEILYVNPAFEQITGYSSEEVIGLTPAVLRSGEHDEEFYRHMWHTILGGKPFHGEFVNRRKDGTLVHVDKTITPITNADGSIDCFVATGTDVTEIRLAEQDRRRHRDDMAHVTRVGMMGEMASSIAHELNQPLAAIANYAQGCVRRLSSREYKVGQIIAALENINQQSKRSGEIIRRLRSFVSKGESKRSRADINQIVQNAASLAYFEARKKGIILRLNFGTRLPPIHADVIQIEQVVLNLIRNAIDAMAKNLWNKRELRIHTWSDGRQVVVAVWDTGHGLLPEDQRRLFDPFFTTKQHGMGMGLSISRSIVEAHGGSLSASNNSDQGATFRFTLPVMRDEDEDNEVTYEHAS